LNYGDLKNKLYIFKASRAEKAGVPCLPAGRYPLSRLAGSASPASPIPPRREGRAGGNYGRIK